ncbi:signal transduction histidine kinase [Larkinella arboricola]|uniref:histidine kinase n=1 Tax=Larkinella arboricola TaxID=643671 RepID=A0A327X6E5_LARAB|nr:response regulator [Larkinella arboricola]RAK02690.1 signal transduction histidine kinase [Larkinella arboricola]
MRISSTKWLSIGSVIALVIFVTLGLIAFRTIRNQLEEARWVEHSYQVLNQIGRTRQLLIDMETGRRGFRSTSETRFLKPYNDALHKVMPAASHIKDLVSDNPKQTERAVEIERGVLEILQYWKSQSNDASQYSRADIVRITDGEKARMDTLRQQLATMIRVEEVLLANREKESNRAVELAITVFSVGAVFLLGLGVLLYYLFSSEIRKRQRAEVYLQQNLDEVEQLNQVSTEKNWMLTGMSLLNDTIQAVTESDSLAQEVLQTITRYLDIPAGGFYCYDEEGQLLELNAAVALPAQIQRTYGLHEGLVGQAATSHEIVVTNHVPAAYWSIRSGSGQAVAGQIVCVPLWYKKELKGVLELATFQALSPAQLDLLKTVGNNIAIALNAAEARKRVMRLLEQVQEQKGALEHQQEELRQSNEELTRQAEILQASEEELRVQEEELRQINAELEEKNEAVEVGRQALAEKARELENNSQYKSEFLANMSHELRTPLNSVLILAKMLSENKNSNLTAKQIEYAQVIHKSGSDLLNLINDILDLSKIEAGKVDMVPENTSVSNMIHDQEQLFSVVAEQKEVKLVTEIDESVPQTLFIAKTRLEQVIKNLLSNAFKFTPVGGTVTLSFRTKAPMNGFTNEPLIRASRLLVISVTDTGIGIPADKQQLIFEAFQQADGSTSRKYGGTGLGLSISKELVKRLGGEMRLHSEEGKGSTFTIYLPLVEAPTSASPTRQPTPEPSQQPAPVKDKVTHLQADIVEQNDLKDDRNAVQKGDKVMLIVEDDPAFASVVQDFARGKGYKTVVALRGDEGIYYARKYKPSAIILDMQLPVVDGWNVLSWLKNDETLKDIPVHVMSAADEPKSGIGSALAYLRKPVEKQDLEKAFGRISDHLHAQIKQVLVLSGNYLNDDSLQQIIGQRQFELECEYVRTNEEALEKLRERTFDCLIVDMGGDLENGLEQLKQLREAMPSEQLPVIIYMDKDLSPADEWKLKKLSDVVIRESSQSIDRLMDELELFLYKVQEVETKDLPQPLTQINDQSLQGKKVLLVDDDMRNVFALSTLLEDQQMEVLTAVDGREALETLQQNPDVDVVLMDIMMPEMDGYEATRRIRTDLKRPHLPVIALTAKAMPGDREKAIEAGASDYITKPVDSGRLFSLMRVWLSVKI